ncbi:MAG: glutathione S-transferase family protein [Rhodospirillaceae bacterium]|jgi:glutathione S-transferase|nr:glutathione S-transferase family protein [Rhodospirillaceae bacterium]MBT5192680.1 glutathione S-transferase family protein [Rhodospirillaceae bacterium]MBT5896475.1 glutathione S-transferase family protein [Rhodospirillaceae bacterium]MBT6430706.1 glutathione S-transferase family protein [Rhodospirillaceae bacterium]MBT7758872.1 glutathione S-transferase family protein [Rhodospirillaceae bacterium]
MLKVYGRNNSVNVQKVMWLIGELGLDHERLDVGGAFGQNDQDWYLALNPMGRVPVLDDDGYILWESHAIVRYLARLYGGGEWYSDDAKSCGDMDKWMDWKQGFLQPALTPVFWGLIRTPEADRDHAAIEAGAKESANLFGLLDRHLAGRDFMAGDGLSIADIPVGALTYRWYGLDVEHPDYPSLRAWYEKLTERPAYREHVMLPIT